MNRIFILTLSLLLSFGMKAQDRPRNLDIKTRIDSVYVFGFDLTESRSAKGGIWNTRTGKPETLLNYTEVRKDTIDSLSVVKLYRQVALGNHPLNGWETWARKEDGWICIEQNGGHPVSVIETAEPEDSDRSPDGYSPAILPVQSARFTGEDSGVTSAVRSTNSSRRTQVSHKFPFRVIKAGKVIDKYHFFIFRASLLQFQSGIHSTSRYIHSICHLLI